MDNMFQIVRYFSDLIVNDRTPLSTLNHLDGESVECREEIEKVEKGLAPGVDGVFGEAIDIIACALDIINQITKDRDPKEVEALCNEYMVKKCQKWADNY